MTLWGLQLCSASLLAIGIKGDTQKGEAPFTNFLLQTTDTPQY